MRVLLASALLLACLAPAAEEKPGALRLLVITGGHDYETSFYELFSGMRWDHAQNNREAFRKDIRDRYDVALFYNMSSQISETERQNLKDFAEAGKGIVVLHHALASYNDWPWWYEEVVGARYLLKPQGSTPGSTYKHDVWMNVQPVGKHPIIEGVGPMRIFDETYKGMWFKPGLQVLMRTDETTSDGPVVWVGPYRNSRVAVIQLGHGREAHESPGFRRLLMNATKWAGGKSD